jgi:NADP-dependent 3-hydroxy acid dehydrogenase YdfG
LITGASDGMGRATSLYLSSQGVDVALAARREEVTRNLAEEITEKFKTHPLPLSVDVTKDTDVESAIAKIMEKYERLDLVVNFAGNPAGYVSGERRKPIFEQELTHMKEIAEVDHFGSVRVLKYALPYMIKQGSGLVILISSTASVYGYSENVDYIPYKRANEGLATSTALRSEREGWGVRLHTLAPGDTFNPSTWDSYGELEKSESLEYGLISSESVAKVVSWLFSGRLSQRYEMKVDVDSGRVLDEGRYVPLRNGDIIVVDAKTMPKIFQAVGETYETFVPQTG